MSITFNTIPLTLRTPGIFTEVDASKAVQGLLLTPHNVLLAGQKLAAGSATANQVYQVRSPDEAKALFGSTSQLAQMVAAYKALDSLSPVFCVGLADNGSGVAATGSITWTGTATEAGSIPLYIGGRRVVVAVPNGTTATQLETAALAALALEPNLPVTVAANASTGLDFTAVNAGVNGNQIFLGVCLLPGERVPAGLTVTVNAMASGATEPSHAAVITAMGEDQYHTVAIGSVDATEIARYVTELESRWGLRQIEGHAFAAKYETQGNLTTFGNSFNSANLTVVGAEKSAALPLPWELAAQAAAASALQCQVDPSRAYTGVSFSGFTAAPRGSRFTRAERDTLLSDGISTVVAGSDGRLRIERLITTYQTNALSLPDTSLMDLYTVRTLAALRETLRNRIGVKFANFKLANDGGEISGQQMVTPKIMRGEILTWFKDCQALGWVENFEQFKRELIVERDGNDPNRVNAILPPDLINAFLVGAFQLQFRR